MFEEKENGQEYSRHVHRSDEEEPDRAGGSLERGGLPERGAYVFYDWPIEPGRQTAFRRLVVR